MSSILLRLFYVRDTVQILVLSGRLASVSREFFSRSWSMKEVSLFGEIDNRGMPNINARHSASWG